MRVDFEMGGSVSQVFRSGSALLSNRDGKVSEHTIDKIHTVFEILRANPKISMQTLEGLLTQIAKVSIDCVFLLSYLNSQTVYFNSRFNFMSFDPLNTSLLPHFHFEKMSEKN